MIGRIFEFLTENQMLVPLLIALCGVAAGFIFEKIVLVWLKHITSKTEWEGDDIIVGALKGVTFIWFTLGGIWVAVASAPLISDTSEKHLHKIIAAGFIMSATFVVSKIAVGFVRLYSGKAAGVLPSSTIFVNLTRTVVMLLGALVVLQTFGISITPVLTALGVGGLAVALALQDTLSNFFSGLQILLARQIKTGDFIKLETGEEGYVVDITWRNTTIKTLPNNLVVIPNAKLASAIVSNYYMPDKEIAVLVPVGVSYSSDLKRVEKVTIEVARDVMKSVSGGVPDFEPFIRYHTFGDSSINFTVIMRAKEFTDQFLIKHEFIKRLHERYAAENINIPFPIRTVYLEKSQ